MEFSKYFLDAPGVIWFPLQSLIQVPWIQANSEASSVLNGLQCWNQLELSFPLLQNCSPIQSPL